MAGYLTLVSENVSEAGALIVEAESVKLTDSGDLAFFNSNGEPIALIAAGEWFYLERDDADVEEIDDSDEDWECECDECECDGECDCECDCDETCGDDCECDCHKDAAEEPKKE